VQVLDPEGKVLTQSANLIADCCPLSSNAARAAADHEHDVGFTESIP
jgi:hypothetical protein